jgi:hypothetical protein
VSVRKVQVSRAGGTRERSTDPAVARPPDGTFSCRVHEALSSGHALPPSSAIGTVPPDLRRRVLAKPQA